MIDRSKQHFKHTTRMIECHCLCLWYISSVIPRAHCWPGRSTGAMRCRAVTSLPLPVRAMHNDPQSLSADRLPLEAQAQALRTTTIESAEENGEGK